MWPWLIWAPVALGTLWVWAYIFRQQGKKQALEELKNAEFSEAMKEYAARQLLKRVQPQKLVELKPKRKAK